MVFSGFLIFFTLRRPRNAKSPAISTITTNTMVNAAQRGSQMARIPATMNQKKNIENAPITAGDAEEGAAGRAGLDRFGDLQLGQLDLRADQRRHMRRDVLDQVAHRGVAVDRGLGDQRDDAPVDPGTVNWFGGVGVPEVVTALS